MMRALYIAKTGIDASQFKLDVVANNLANVSTKGFKRSNPVFEDLIYQIMRAPGSRATNNSTQPTGLLVGTGVAAVASVRVHTNGAITMTDQWSDMAVQGNGFFSVEMGDGTIAYTRNGEFQRNAEGLMVNHSGYALAAQINIPAEATSVSISNTGSVEYTLAGNDTPVAAGDITLTSFINPQGLLSIGENLYLPTGASGDPQEGQPGLDGRGTIRQSYIEQSNVNMAQEIIEMIQAQRAYEVNTKAVKTADEMLARLVNL
jgi:flagellar basal-body rod protein FlgG